MISQVLNSAISHNTFYKSSCRADRLPIKNFNLTKYFNETIQTQSQGWGRHGLVAITWFAFIGSRLDSKDRLIPPDSIFNMWAGVKAWVVVNKLQELSVSEGSFH